MKQFGSVVTLTLVALASGAGAQEPDLPPGARSKVLDLVFKVESFGAKQEDLKVKETDLEVRLELAADVLFDFDKATLRPNAEETLAKAAAFIKERATGVVRIEGHTDSKGNDAYNQRLSERRADSVRQWFVRHGLGGLKFSAGGFGETRPIAPNARADGADDPEGRQKNRRVEIVIAKRL
jgi:outer membrane protein OmpA-like peptidoglycan-associated protein